MTFNRLCILSVVAAPLALVATLWVLGVLPVIDAWRWKTALVIHVDPVAIALMFFASMLVAGKALDILRARYDVKNLQRRG